MLYARLDRFCSHLFWGVFNPFRESGPINGSFFLKNRPKLLKSMSLRYIWKAKSVFDLHETWWIDQKQSNFVISGKFITKNYTSDCVLLWLFEIDPYVGQFSRKGGCSRKGLSYNFWEQASTSNLDFYFDYVSSVRSRNIFRIFGWKNEKSWILFRLFVENPIFISEFSYLPSWSSVIWPFLKILYRFLSQMTNTNGKSY